MAKNSKNTNKSVQLSSTEKKELKKLLSLYPTMIKASIELRVGRETLIRTADLGRCSPETYEQIFNKKAPISEQYLEKSE